MSQLEQLATKTMASLLSLGAEEAVVSVSEGTHTTLQRRDGKVEQATEASTRGLAISLLVDDRWSNHSTSDLRDDALATFMARAVEATRLLEPDPDRRLPPVQECGRGVSEETLDQLDPHFSERTTEQRATEAVELERAVAEHAPNGLVSSSTFVADGRSRAVMVMSNGFSGSHEGAWFSSGGEATLTDGERRPEAYAYYGARYRGDLPSPEAIAIELRARAHERIGSGPVASGTYPMILANHAVGRILGILAGPLSGGAIHQRRSCLADKLGETIGASCLTIIDDPTLPRGLGSRPWDSDGRVARVMPVIEAGVLKRHYINTYYSRKLGVSATTSGSSNWVVRPGDRSPEAIAAALPKAILVTGFLGGNSNAATGDFSFGIRGVLLENGAPTRSLSEMNVRGSVLDVFKRLAEVGDDPWGYSSVRSPSLLFADMEFSGA